MILCYMRLWCIMFVYRLGPVQSGLLSGVKDRLNAQRMFMALVQKIE